MNSDIALSAVKSQPDVAAPRRVFFVAYAAVCLVILVAGFGRPFFFRPAFLSEPLPLIVVAHGVVLTAWFVLFLVQSLLIANRRIEVHRQLGIVGCGIAIVAVIVFVPTAVGFYPRQVGVEVTSAVRTAQIMRDSMGFAAFPVFVSLAIWFRRRLEAHKRLMLLATVSLLPPAISRIFRIPILAEVPGRTLILFGLLTALLVAPIIYDIVVRKRVHPVLAWGVPLYFAWFLASNLIYSIVSAG